MKKRKKNFHADKKSCESGVDIVFKRSKRVSGYDTNVVVGLLPLGPVTEIQIIDNKIIPCMVNCCRVKHTLTNCCSN